VRTRCNAAAAGYLATGNGQLPALMPAIVQVVILPFTTTSFHVAGGEVDARCFDGRLYLKHRGQSTALVK
jgi:hypothetical protein